MLRTVFLITILAGALAHADPLQKDTPETAPGGGTLTAPAEWTVTADKQKMVLAAPEGDLHFAAVDAGAAKDIRAALAAAWAAYRPGEKHALKLTAPKAAKDGWDQEAVAVYETSPEEHLFIQAALFRTGTQWRVLLIDGSESTVEKRAAQSLLIAQSFRPAGYRKESFAGRTPRTIGPQQLGALRIFLAESMRKLRIPGIGYGIIQNGRVVYEGGIGVRRMGQPEKIDAHTRFMIASNTKGLTTLMLARLVDQHKLGWDQHVTDVYPAFRLGSADVTKQVLIRHLICACTGLPRRDFEWLFDTRADTPASDTFKQLAETVPTSRFGEVFQYNNLMASAAGYVGGHILFPDAELGAAYDRAMQAQVFGPLGMGETTFDYGLALSGDHASPHGDTIDGQQVPIGMEVNDTILPFRPAGAAWSTVHDMLRYVQEELTPGRTPEGRQIVSEANVLARRHPNVPLGEEGSYGMGLMNDGRWGLHVVHHGGDLAGFHSDWYAITEAGVGAVILTNGDNGPVLRGPFERRLLEILYDGHPEAAATVAASATQIDAEIAKERPHLQVPPDPKAVAGLAARYTNAGLGTISVSRQGDRVFFATASWKTEVASRRNDDGTMSFVAIDPQVQGIPAVVTTVGGKRGLVVRDGQHKYIFVES